MHPLFEEHPPGPEKVYERQVENGQLFIDDHNFEGGPIQPGQAH
jgi:hypothetical protein